MAVLTMISDQEASALVTAYGLGKLYGMKGIAAGSVNSNFALEGDGRRLFLRVYEERGRLGAEREAAMLDRLSRAGVPSPAPLRRDDGVLESEGRGKAAALFPWGEGT